MYTKHKWSSDIYHNFGYVKYLPCPLRARTSYIRVLTPRQDRRRARLRRAGRRPADIFSFRRNPSEDSRHN